MNSPWLAATVRYRTGSGSDRIQHSTLSYRSFWQQNCRSQVEGGSGRYRSRFCKNHRGRNPRAEPGLIAICISTQQCALVSGIVGQVTLRLRDTTATNRVFSHPCKCALTTRLAGRKRLAPMSAMPQAFPCRLLHPLRSQPWLLHRVPACQDETG